MRALCINTLGQTQIELVDEINLGFLQQKVDGFIEAVDLTPDVCMWVNEEGKVYGLDANTKATNLAWKGQSISMFDYIAGDVVITGFDPESGDSIGLACEQIDTILDFLRSE